MSLRKSESCTERFSQFQQQNDPSHNHPYDYYNDPNPNPNPNPNPWFSKSGPGVFLLDKRMRKNYRLM